ncbi:MAG: recombinase family protein, partial [Bdellovibrionales bacterium]|nr:recombinase family protein [Bdellovibrionales bacterium]
VLRTGGQVMTRKSSRKKPAVTMRCAVYTRKRTEEGLDQEFNSLDAQREAAEAYIASQKSEGWVYLADRYDDGGFTGGNMDRPALKRLLADIEAGKVDCVAVYKVDRISRSLMDFARMMEVFERQRVAFVSVTQHFNTANSMGRLILNVLLSFAQFEREIISERTRDKIAAARRKGKWSGGKPMLGYDLDGGPGASKLVVNEAESKQVQAIYELYLEKQSLVQVARELAKRGWTTKQWTTRKGRPMGGKTYDKCNLHKLITNALYVGKVRYKDELHPGEHEAIVDEDLWQKAQRILRMNGRAGGSHTRNRYGALLKGLLYCRPCGVAMGHTFTNGKSKRRYRYYTCYTASKRGWDSCPSKSLPAEEIEQFVIEQIRTLGNDPTLRSMVLDQIRNAGVEQATAIEGEAGIARREIRQLQAEIKSAAKSAGENSDAAVRLADLHEQLASAEARLEDLRSQISDAENDSISKSEVDAALDEFDSIWDALSPREQTRALRLLIKRVDYDGGAGKVAITFHANGIETVGSAS